jgi:carboxypeptidase Taq
LAVNEKINIALTWEDYTKNKKYTGPFVRKLSEQISKTYHAWLQARKTNSFSGFEKELSQLILLKKEEAFILGFEKHPYDALLNEYEKGATVSFLDKIFSGLLPDLKVLLNKIEAKPQVDDSFLKQHFPKQQQWEWGMYLIKALNFDFESGRQDISEHPFSTSFNNKDVRITTRIEEEDFGNMTWSCIHEVGHALYEQGLLGGEYGLPLGEPCSYSIHESQSRLWENNVGRSKAFWHFYYPKLQELFPKQLGSIGLEAFYKGINKVKPSLIRTEADEITYHFHVHIRYELEKKLLEGSLKANDIPAFWNERYYNDLNVLVPDDKTGCLQDVHWSHGSFGYFPTYSLGSLYATQFFEKAKNEQPQFEEQIKEGNNQWLLSWLRTNVHDKGRLFTSDELCTNITGQSLQVSGFISQLLEKYTAIYNL